ncbi:MAG: rhomboid family intramembrane serine protease [Planctomycetes bacterium]|nr:rhomboid family intramembrane serine protease [Planctomycetota bacterium]
METPSQNEAKPTANPLPAVLITDNMLADSSDESGKTDFEKDISFLPPLTIALIGINILVFIWELAAGKLENEVAIISAGALYRPLVMQGEIWRLITCMFLHGSFDHLIGNCIAFYILGMACEHAYKYYKTSIIYFLSGISGALFSILIHEGPSVGASGAIFGLMGAAGVFFYKHQKHFFLRDKRIGFIIVIWALYQIGTGFLTPFIDNSAHIGGFIGGGAITFFLVPELVAPASPKEPVTLLQLEEKNIYGM